METVDAVEVEFPIRPEHIDASKHLFEAFDHMETEVSAGWIVRMLQWRGEGWAPFTKSEIEAFYSASGEFSGFCFNRLVNPGRAFFIRTGWQDAGGGWILVRDGKYHVTEDFIIRCFKSRPVKNSELR